MVSSEKTAQDLDKTESEISILGCVNVLFLKNHECPCQIKEREDQVDFLTLHWL